MAYVAVSGGEEAIEESIRLLEYYKSGTEADLEIEAIEHKLSLLVDRVMSEAGLYATRYAALALKQCEGSVEEAVFLLRAYRSTLSRNYYTEPVDSERMRIIRRISAAFKDIAGGQILGATYDYTHRLIDFAQSGSEAGAMYRRSQELLEQQEAAGRIACPRVSGTLKAEGLIDDYGQDDRPPFDVTANMVEFPTDRSARLQTLSRADTGFISGLAYSALRGFGQIHPTVGELRCGYLELYVPYRQTGTNPGGSDSAGSGSDNNNGQESLYIGEVLVTEVECFNEADDQGQLKLAVGYGAVFGRNENKAIAMAVIDRELENGGPHPVQDEEFVLTHGDSLEMNGFISHLKLPHYVTFQSKLDAVRKTREGRHGESI